MKLYIQVLRSLQRTKNTEGKPLQRLKNSILFLHLQEVKKKMCYKVECSKCGKFTWNGCGKHVANVYDGIEKGKHCSCKPWTGVDTKAAEGSTSAAKEGETPVC